ncbi:hypothetical protein BDZ97DRAFT_596665 [Flammula alnicola]|nr:hypothetical protein BDZ97DRAFT_596665 [Flammula alnicola]
MTRECAFCGSTANQGVYDNDSLCSKISNLNPCNPCKRLAELDIQIIKARETLLAMQKEARRLKSEMNCSHDHLIHRLPPEISSYIFQLCISREPSIDARYSQVALSSVCQKWRQIAHTTPQLWTTIFLSVSRHSDLSVADWTQEWIDRSGQLPLSIGLFAKSESKYYTVYRYVIAVINQCSSRWRDLTYQGPASSLSDLVGDSQGASQLQTLKLHVHGSSAGQFKLGDFKPMPTTLEIRGLDLKSVVIEWNNITHMQARRISADDCWELFRIAPRMTHCRLELVLNIKAQDPFPRPHTPILHPTLQVLEMSLVTSCSFDLFLNNVSLPSLKSYTSDVGSGYLETESLISLFLRSSCSLQTLTLLDLGLEPLDVADLVDLSRATPDLRHLDLKSSYRSGADVTERIFRCFSNAFTITSTDSETNQALFPRLQSMTFKGAMPLDWKLVPDIFGSPSDVCNLRRRPLRSFTLSPVKAQPIDDFIIDKDTLSRMLLLVTQGIELKIEQESPSVDALQRSIEFHAHDSALGDSLRDPNRLREE